MAWQDELLARAVQSGVPEAAGPALNPFATLLGGVGGAASDLLTRQVAQGANVPYTPNLNPITAMGPAGAMQGWTSALAQQFGQNMMPSNAPKAEGQEPPAFRDTLDPMKQFVWDALGKHIDKQVGQRVQGGEHPGAIADSFGINNPSQGGQPQMPQGMATPPQMMGGMPTNAPIEGRGYGAYMGNQNNMPGMPPMPPQMQGGLSVPQMTNGMPTNQATPSQEFRVPGMERINPAQPQKSAENEAPLPVSKAIEEKHASNWQRLGLALMAGGAGFQGKDPAAVIKEMTKANMPTLEEQAMAIQQINDGVEKGIYPKGTTAKWSANGQVTANIPNEAQQTRAEVMKKNANMRAQESYMKKVIAPIQDVNSAVGTEARKVNMAVHGMELLKGYYDPKTGNFNMPPSMHTEMAMQLARLISPSGQQGEHMIDMLRQKTAREQWADLAIYAGADPAKVGGPTQEVIKVFADSLRRQGMVSEKIRDKYVSGLKKMHVSELDPEDEKRINEAVPELNMSFSKYMEDYDKSTGGNLLEGQAQAQATTQGQAKPSGLKKSFTLPSGRTI